MMGVRGHNEDPADHPRRGTVIERRRLLQGWGHTSPSVASVHEAGGNADLSALLATVGPRGVLARGLGRSYGDAAQNGGGLVLDMTTRDKVLSIDVETGVVCAEAGVSLDSLMRTLLPLGLCPVIIPGTRQVTLGGAVAADVHGKNHHVDGAFGQHVVSMDLLAADGSVRTLTPEDELFWATVGGMGLTGVVLRVTLRTRRVETAFCVVDTDRCANLDELLQRMGDDDQYTYSVAWVDCLARGPHLGRSVLTRGWPATLDRLSGRDRSHPLAFDPRRRVTAPRCVPNGVLNRWTVGAFNEAWFRKSPARRRGQVAPLGFLQPLDGIAQWNRIYGPAGFLQYQFVVPVEATDTLRRCLQMVSEAGQGCFLAVLKRLGPAGRGYLSFPMPGWTLTLDMPAGSASVGNLVDRLDEEVLAAGGRVYLAKDSRLPPSALPAMYPKLEQFRAVRLSVDPSGLFTSDLARRLHL